MLPKKGKKLKNIADKPPVDAVQAKSIADQQVVIRGLKAGSQQLMKHFSLGVNGIGNGQSTVGP